MTELSKATLHDTLASLQMGPATTFRNLTLFALRGNQILERDYVTLKEAVQDGSVSVGEISRGGSVSELLLKNKSKQPVLILDGEELVGAKQNRTANITILAPAGKKTRIPVTCVEAGRWEYRSRSFAPSEQLHFARGRRTKMVAVTQSLGRSGTHEADQGEVWAGIADKATAMRASAPTGAMSDVFEAHRGSVDDYVAAFWAQPGQTAAVFAIGDRIEGLELFDCARTFCEMLPKLIRSYAIDAIERAESETDDGGQVPGEASARAFMERLSAAEVEEYPAVGLGTEVRMKAPGVVAGGLVVAQRVVHLAAFAEEAAAARRDPRSPGMERAQTRRTRLGRVR